MGGDEIKIVATAAAKTQSGHVIDAGRTEGIAEALEGLHRRYTTHS